jgi:multidrug resistance efflux pump
MIDEAQRQTVPATDDRDHPAGSRTVREAAVPAGVSGTVREVLAENAGLVEYGAPLFCVEPAQ